jgi:hypothetical protein
MNIITTIIIALALSLAGAAAPARTPRYLAHRTGEIFLPLEPEVFNNCCMVNDHRSATAPAVAGATSTHWLLDGEVGTNGQKTKHYRTVVADFGRSLPGLTGTKNEAKAALATARRYFAPVAKTVEANFELEMTQTQAAAGTAPMTRQRHIDAIGYSDDILPVPATPLTWSVIIDSGIAPVIGNVDAVYSKSFVDGSALEDPSTTGFMSPYPYGHGTLMAGVVGAINRNARLVSYRVWYPISLGNGNTTLTTSYDRILKAFVASLDLPSDHLVINASFAEPFEEESMDLWKEAIIALGDRAIVVAAAGNNGDTVPQYPCAFGLANVVCVTATDSTNNLATFSSHGPWVHLAALGVDVLSIGNNGTYQMVTGTSIAVPIVRDVAVGLWELKPWLTSAEVRQLLLDGATFNPLLIGKLSAPRQLNYTGSLAALERGRLITPTPEISIASISPDPSHLTWGQTVTVRGSNFTDGYTGTASKTTPVTWLNGIVVIINQFPVPLLSVGPEEIAFVVPNDTFRVLPGNNNLTVVRFGDLTYAMSTLSWATEAIHVGGQ